MSGAPQSHMSSKLGLFHSSSLGRSKKTAHNRMSPRSSVYWTTLFSLPIVKLVEVLLMLAYGGLRSCTWSEFSLDIFDNSTLIPQSNAGSQCDLTLLTCLLIGSYRFCIVPLLAACYGKSKTPLQRSKLC